MKNTLIFLCLLMLIIPVFAETKGNPDILKRQIIDECEGIDEFGDCIVNQEIEPINEKLTRNVSSLGQSTATNLGIGGSAELVTIFIILVLIGAFIVFVLKQVSGSG